MATLSDMSNVERYAAIEAAAWTKIGGKPRDIVQEILVSSTTFMNKSDQKTYSVEFAAGLDKKSPLLLTMIDLLRTNMKPHYETSGWGWNEKKKLRELTEDDARFLIIKDPTDGR
jgi:hypothetical protein